MEKDGGDGGHRKDRKDQCLQEMTLHRTINKDSCVQAVSYSSALGEPQSYDSQFTRFRNFAQDSCSSYKDSLEALLYPVFVHFYMDMLCNGQKSQAHKFYSRHSGQFLVGDNSDMVNELELMYNKQDILDNTNLTQFRHHKYVVGLSTAALQYLQRYLKQEDNLVILQVFNNHIDIKVEGCEINQDLFQNEDRDLEGLEPVSQPCTPENKVIQDEVTLSSLQSCITQVRNGPPAMPSVCMYTLLNTFQGLCCTTFSPDERYLVGGFEDSGVRLWDLTPRYTAEIKASQPQGRGTTTAAGAAASGSCDSCSDSVNVNQVHLCGDYSEDVSAKNRSHPSSADGSVVLRGHCGAVYSCSFIHDSTHLLSTSEDTTVRLWDVERRRNVVCYRGHTYPVWSVDSSPVCDYFATSSQDSTVRLWSTDRLYPLRTCIGHSRDVNVVRFHPNGLYVASGSSDRSVRMWSIQEGKCVRLFQGHKSGIFSLAFSSDGTMLASAGDDRRIKVWDLSTGTLFKELKGHTDIIYSLCFNKDNSVLVSGGMDASLRLWDVRREVTSTNNLETYSSPELLGAFSTKSACVHSVVYSKNNYIRLAGGLLS